MAIVRASASKIRIAKRSIPLFDRPQAGPVWAASVFVFFVPSLVSFVMNQGPLRPPYFSARPATTAPLPNLSLSASMAFSVFRVRASVLSNRAAGASTASTTSPMPIPIRR